MVFSTEQNQGSSGKSKGRGEKPQSQEEILLLFKDVFVHLTL